MTTISKDSAAASGMGDIDTMARDLRGRPEMHVTMRTLLATGGRGSVGDCYEHGPSKALAYTSRGYAEIDFTTSHTSLGSGRSYPVTTIRLTPLGAAVAEAAGPF